MTDQQLRQAQEYKRKIQQLTDELEKFENPSPHGINVFLPNVGTLIDDVRRVFIEHLNMFDDKFRKL